MRANCLSHLCVWHVVEVNHTDDREEKLLLAVKCPGSINLHLDPVANLRNHMQQNTSMAISDTDWYVAQMTVTDPANLSFKR